MEQRSRPNASPSLRAIACRMSMKWSEVETSLRISMTASRCVRSRSSSATRAARRSLSAAAAALRRRALAARIGRGVALIPAAHERNVERDYVQDNDFRQTNTFFYLTELETQDAWLLIVAGGEAATTVLFLPPRTPSQERWTGLRLGPDSTAARLCGIGRVLPTDSLDRMLAAALFRASGPIYAPLDVTTRDEPRLKELVF